MPKESKWSQNRCPKSSKINAKTGKAKMMKIIKNHVSLNGKIIQINCKNYFLKGLAGCVRERQRYPENIKDDIKIHLKSNAKSIQFSCSKK